MSKDSCLTFKKWSEINATLKKDSDLSATRDTPGQHSNTEHPRSFWKENDNPKLATRKEPENAASAGVAFVLNKDLIEIKERKIIELTKEKP